MNAINYFQKIFSHPIDVNIVNKVLDKREIIQEQQIEYIDPMVQELIIADILTELFKCNFLNSLQNEIFYLVIDGKETDFINNEQLHIEAQGIYKSHHEL